MSLKSRAEASKVKNWINCRYGGNGNENVIIIAFQICTDFELHHNCQTLLCPNIVAYLIARKI
jgi:hypothetical protein